MKKRSFLPVMLVVMVVLSITPLYIAPASACWEKPKVEIWKKFMDTSDPPPYKLKTEYHWDIEIGVWTSVYLKSARVYDRFGAELKIDYIQTPDKTYTFTYLDYESKYPTKQAYVSISDGTTTIVHKLDWRGVTFGTKPYRFRIYWSGGSHKIHFTWYIENLEADETITIIVGVSTDLNPGGKQEYTSPCEHCINSGAVLKAKYKDKCRWRYICATSEKLCIKVQCEEPLPAKLIIEKFNDIDNIGVFDEGIDEMITGWTIYVTYPGGTTTPYTTPVTLDITEFGTYTITEDLPGDWEQTVLRVDGDYKTPTVSWIMVINEGETHDILYGNKLPPPHPAKLIIDKFHDTDGNGVYEEGIDIILTGWEIYVTDPDAVTTTHFTPISLDITNFGTYTIRENIPADWEQTAVRVDGTYIAPPTAEVTVLVNEGETHDVLYGNKETAPPVPPKIKIGLGIYPNIVRVGSTVTFSWKIDSPAKATPVKVELRLIDPYGVETILYTGTTFPDDLINSKTWTATGPTGSWKGRVIYYYNYAGFDMKAKATQGFVVIP